MDITMYYDKDADNKILKDKKIAVIGYGSQGHAQAQNLKESGYDVTVAEVEGSDNYKLAVKHGFDPVSAAEASQKADIIQILVPDEVQKTIYVNEIKDNLSQGDALVFSHGFNIHFNQIVPPVVLEQEKRELSKQASEKRQKLTCLENRLCFVVGLQN